MSHLHKNKEYYINTHWTIERVQKEINDGLSLLNKIDNKGSVKLINADKH